MPGNRSTCALSEYYWTINWPVLVDKLTVCKQTPEVYSKFMLLFYFLSNIGKSYAVAMNWDNPDTRIIEKIGGFQQISFLVQKNSWLEYALPWFKLSMKGNLNLNSRSLATEIQVHVKISQFITLLLVWFTSATQKKKVSMRTIWLVAYNLTNGIYCAVKYIFEGKQESSLVLNILALSISLVIYL